jgi:hypothetical protein
MQRWRRITVDHSSLEGSCTNWKKALASNEVSARLPYLGHSALDVDDYYFALILKHIEYEDLDRSGRDLATTGAWAAWAYFYGDWRAKAKKDRRTKEGELQWYDAYREGLLMTLLLGDSTRAADLLAWPTPSCPYDSEFADHTRQEQASHVVLAAVVRGDVNDEVRKELTAHRSSKTRGRGGLMFTAAAHLLEEDIPGIVDCASALVKQWKQKADARNPIMLVDLDASLLLLMASDKGSVGLDLRPDIMDWLMTPESIGMK